MFVLQKRYKWSTGSSPGQQRRNYKNNDTAPPALPEKQGNKLHNSRPQLPIQDPPWMKKKTSSAQSDDDRLDKPFPLPMQDPPWKKKSPSIDDKPKKPLPKPPVQDPPWLKRKTSDDRLEKPCPLPPSRDPPSWDPPWSKKKSPYDHPDGGNRPVAKLPPSVPQKTGKSRDARFSLHDGDSPPPPLPPERGSSKKDLFVTPPKVANKSRQPVGKKPVPPPVKPKSPQPVLQDDDDDDDFPTADQYKKSQAFAQPTHYSRPPSHTPMSQYHDPIDDRPPIPPPKQSTGYHYR